MSGCWRYCDIIKVFFKHLSTFQILDIESFWNKSLIIMEAFAFIEIRLLKKKNQRFLSLYMFFFSIGLPNTHKVIFTWKLFSYYQVEQNIYVCVCFHACVLVYVCICMQVRVCVCVLQCTNFVCIFHTICWPYFILKVEIFQRKLKVGLWAKVGYMHAYWSNGLFKS